MNTRLIQIIHSKHKIPLCKFQTVWISDLAFFRTVFKLTGLIKRAVHLKCIRRLKDHFFHAVVEIGPTARPVLSPTTVRASYILS